MCGGAQQLLLSGQERGLQPIKGGQATFLSKRKIFKKIKKIRDVCGTKLRAVADQHSGLRHLARKVVALDVDRSGRLRNFSGENFERGRLSRAIDAQ